MTKGQQILAHIKVNPGARPSETARAVRLSANVVAAHCKALAEQGKLDRVATGKTFLYFEKGKVPASALLRYIPTEEEARKIFERATADVPHEPGALSGAWEAFNALRNSAHDIAIFLSMMDAYEALARSRRPEVV